MQRFGLEVVASSAPAILMTLWVQPTLLEKIKENQAVDEKLQKVRSDIEDGSTIDFSVDSEGVLKFRGQLCVPGDEKIRKEILQEAHQSSYTIHSGGTKMYKNLRAHF